MAVYGFWQWQRRQGRRRSRRAVAGRSRATRSASAGIVALSLVSCVFSAALHAGRMALRGFDGDLVQRLRHLSGGAQGVRELALVAGDRFGRACACISRGTCISRCCCSRLYLVLDRDRHARMAPQSAGAGPCGLAELEDAARCATCPAPAQSRFKRLGAGLVNESYRVARDGARYTLRVAGCASPPISASIALGNAACSSVPRRRVSRPLIEYCEPRRGSSDVALGATAGRGRPRTCGAPRISSGWRELVRRIHALAVPRRRASDELRRRGSRITARRSSAAAAPRSRLRRCDRQRASVALAALGGAAAAPSRCSATATCTPLNLIDGERGADLARLGVRARLGSVVGFGRAGAPTTISRPECGRSLLAQLSRPARRRRAETAAPQAAARGCTTTSACCGANFT